MSKEYEAVRAEHSKVCNLIDQLKNRESDVEETIESLKKRFSKDLAAHALGEVTNGELKTTRAELGLLRRELDEIPWTIEGLEERAAEVEIRLRAHQKAWLKADATERFENLKKELEEKGYTRERYGQLKNFAHYLRRSVEVEDLLEKARETWENLSLGERVKKVKFDENFDQGLTNAETKN